MNASGGSSAGGAGAGGRAPASGGELTGGGCNADCESGGASTGVGGTESGGLDSFVTRLEVLCDAACESIAKAPGCPDLGAACSRDCTADRTEALELGCSFEPMMDCADQHPDVVKSFCEDNSIKPVDPVSCAEILAEYNKCVLDAPEEP